MSLLGWGFLALAALVALLNLLYLGLGRLRGRRMSRIPLAVTLLGAVGLLLIEGGWRWLWLPPLLDIGSLELIPALWRAHRRP